MNRDRYNESKGKLEKRMMMLGTMTLEQLHIFLSVAQHLHLTRAAETLRLNQSAVHAALAHLEEEYGIKLFYGGERNLEITAAGRVLQTEAQKILEHVASTERSLRGFSAVQQGELRIGASFTVGNCWLPEKISQFQRLYPEICIKSCLSHEPQVCDMTNSGLVDVSIITGKLAGSCNKLVQHVDELQPKIIGYDPLCIVVGAAHPWFKQSKVLVSDLASKGWIMQSAESYVQQQFEQSLQDWGVERSALNVLMVLSSSEMVKAVVEQGIGAAILPAMLLKGSSPEVLKPIQLVGHQRANRLLEIVQPIVMLKHPQRQPNQVAIAFEQLILSK